MIGHVGVDPCCQLLVDRTDDLGLDTVGFHDRGGQLDESFGVRPLGCWLQGAVEKEGAQVGVIDGARITKLPLLFVQFHCNVFLGLHLTFGPLSDCKCYATARAISTFAALLKRTSIQSPTYWALHHVGVFGQLWSSVLFKPA